MFENALYALWFLFQFGMETFSIIFTNSFSVCKMFSPSSNIFCVFCSQNFRGQILRTVACGSPIVLAFKIWNVQQFYADLLRDDCKSCKSELNSNPREFCEYWNDYFLIYFIFMMEILQFWFLFFLILFC